MRKRKYSQLDSLTSSRDAEISRLSIIVKSLEERLESIEESHTMICCTRLILLMQKAMQQSQKVEDYQDTHATCAVQNSLIRNIYNSIARTRTKHPTIFRIALVVVRQWR
jgi:hypothetical protein